MADGERDHIAETAVTCERSRAHLAELLSGLVESEEKMRRCFSIVAEEARAFGIEIPKFKRLTPPSDNTANNR